MEAKRVWEVEVSELDQLENTKLHKVEYVFNKDDLTDLMARYFCVDQKIVTVQIDRGKVYVSYTIGEEPEGEGDSDDTSKPDMCMYW